MAETQPALPRARVPPDGGYGWVVCAAYALNNIIVIPVLQNFGLIFKDTFNELEITGTDIAIIMNVNNAFGLALGLFNGPLLRRFGYRKCAIVSSLFVFVGVAMTSYASSFLEFLIYYGIIMSAGCANTMAAFSYAINSYFRKRRSMALGFAMTVTGLGPIFMPLLISLSMREFGARGTALLLSGLTLHSLAAACLLQPVRWHMVLESDEEEKDGDSKEKEGTILSKKPADELGEVEDNRDDDDKDDAEKSMLRNRRLSSVSQRSGAPLSERRRGGDGEGGHFEGGAGLWASMGSVQSMHTMELGGGLAEEDTRVTQLSRSPPNDKHPREQQNNNNQQPNGNALDHDGLKGDAVEHKGVLRRWFQAVVRFFDLNLLRDPIYVNLMVGMSFAVFAEINFSLLTPFILGERNFDTQSIAWLVSMIAIADIVFRFLAPFVKKLFRQSSRVMYMGGLLLLMISRTLLIFAYEYKMVVAVMFALGIAKGLRTVYWTLVIPDYVPIERLPSASGIQSVTNGIVFLALGPLMGVIRDKVGSYNAVIVVVNALTLLTITMWGAEFVILALRRRRSANRDASDVKA